MAFITGGWIYEENVTNGGWVLEKQSLGRGIRAGLYMCFGRKIFYNFFFFFFGFFEISEFGGY